MYGLHTNAGISNQIDTCVFMFETIMTLQGSGGGGGGGGSSKDAAVKALVDEYTERLPDDFNMFEIRTRAVDKTPYVMVVLQETTRMNVLLSEMRRSLIELNMGLEGALNMSDSMEALADSLFLAKVPAGWAKYAYPSKKGLVTWFSDLLSRVNQLESWAATLEVPKSVWISGLFNAQAFLACHGLLQTVVVPPAMLDDLLAIGRPGKRLRISCASFLDLRWEFLESNGACNQG